MGLVELMGASGSQRRITKSIPYMEEREPDPPDCIITGITNTYVVIQVIKSEGCHYASHADLLRCFIDVFTTTSRVGKRHSTVNVFHKQKQNEKSGFVCVC